MPVSYEEYTADITTRQRKTSAEVAQLVADGWSVSLAIQKLQEARALEDEARALEYTENRSARIKEFNKAIEALGENPSDKETQQLLVNTTERALAVHHDLERVVRSQDELTYDTLVTEDRPATPSVVRAMVEPDAAKRAERGENIQELINKDVAATQDAAVEGAVDRAKAQKARREVGKTEKSDEDPRSNAPENAEGGASV